jgi:ribonuclease R
VSELGTEYFLYNEALHELRGERTGIRYRLGDRLMVQVARVDLEARRIDFRLVKADTRKALLASGAEPKDRDRKRGESVEERRARHAKVERRQARRGQLHKIGKKGVRGRDSKVRAAKRERGR